MKNHLGICLIILCITSISTTKAQEKNAVFNVGLGILPGIGGSVSYEHKVKNLGEHAAYGIGGYVGYSLRDGHSLDGGTTIGSIVWESKSLLAPRIVCRYFGPKSEIFAAFMPGLSIDKTHYDRTEYEFFAGITAGLRVRLSKNIYIFVEGGYNVLCINTGLSFKF